MQQVLIIGCGDIGARVAATWQGRGAQVSALTRREEQARALAAAGIRPVRGDLDDPATLTDLGAADALIYYLAPPPSVGTTDPRMLALLAALGTDRPQRLIYISTSGVYGDTRGQWVTEESPLHASTPRAQRRLAAEQALADWHRRSGVTTVILRVAGIYGPERLPRQRIARGDPLPTLEAAPFTNLIHVEDLTQVCLAAATAPAGLSIYNVSDGHPIRMTAYIHAVADALGLARPPTLPLTALADRLSPTMLSYIKESRRLDNGKLGRELQIQLRYPSVTQGLAALE